MSLLYSFISDLLVTDQYDQMEFAFACGNAQILPSLLPAAIRSAFFFRQKKRLLGRFFLPLEFPLQSKTEIHTEQKSVDWFVLIDFTHFFVIAI